MKAIRFPSGDHEARSPKCVNCLMVGGRFSSGLPGLVPWRSHGAAASVKVRSQERIGGIAADFAGGVKNGSNEPGSARSGGLRSPGMLLLRRPVLAGFFLWVVPAPPPPTAAPA